MRILVTPLLVLLAFLMIASALPALAEGGSAGSSEAYGNKPPPSKLRTYQDPSVKKPKRGLNAQGLILIAGLGLVTFGVLFVWFRAQTKELNIPEDEKALAAEMASSGNSVRGGGGSKETIFTALGKIEGWATVGRISMSSGVDSAKTESFLQGLVQEGRAKAGRDKQGRVLYRIL